MSRRPRWAAVATSLALLAAYGAVQSQNAMADSSQAVSDPAGDATVRVDPDTSQAVGTIPNEPRADILSASAEYQASAIVLRVRTAEPADPRGADVDADNTSMNWALDVNNDNKLDYEIEFGAANGALYGDVYNNPQATSPSCSATPSIAADGTWVTSIPLNCVGNPNSFHWGGLMQFTRKGQQPMPADRVPDSGYLGSVDKPGTTPPPTTPTTRPGTPGTVPPTTATTVPIRPIETAPVASNEGFWLLGKDGGVFSFGTAKYFGSIGYLGGAKQIVSMAADPDGTGYWFVANDGGIFAYKAPFWGSTGSVKLTKPIVGMAATPSGKGYWLVASDGGIFAFGDAGFFGSTGAIKLNKPIVGMTPTPSGRGYWLVASDGGIFAFGDAPFFGSTGNIMLNQPIVGMSATPSGRGYWFVAKDGGIFSYGDAGFFGSAVNGSLSDVVGMSATKAGQGYRVARADGSITFFGNAAAGGGLTGTLAAPIVGIATAS